MQISATEKPLVVFYPFIPVIKRVKHRKPAVTLIYFVANPLLMNSISQDCRSCGKPLRGRTDKKFCNDYCRHLHHNKYRGADEKEMKQINRTLKRNRQIIKETINPANEPQKIRREEMLDKGFSFRYFTHEKKCRSGSIYRFCYEYGYLTLSGETLLLVKEDQ